MENEHLYTVEELLLDDSFVAFCLNKNGGYQSHWDTVIRDHPGQKAIFSEAKELVRLLHGGLTQNEVNREIEHVRRALRERSQAKKENAPNNTQLLSTSYSVTTKGEIKRNGWKQWIPYAAAACVLLFIGLGLYELGGKPGSSATEAAVSARFESPFGERRTIDLPDGSIVILNSNSQLSYTEDFYKKNREIELQGDAFFKVAENAELPFVVHSRHISTTALGTEFYVHSQPGESKPIRIDLLKGKVKVAATKKKSYGSEVVLLPGENATTGDTTIRKGAFDVAYLQQWLKGQIVFDQTPVLTAVQQLEDWYSVEINIQKEGLEDKYISGRYNNASLQDIVKVICFSINRQFSVAGNTINIEK